MIELLKNQIAFYLTNVKIMRTKLIIYKIKKNNFIIIIKVKRIKLRLIIKYIWTL